MSTTCENYVRLSQFYCATTLRKDRGKDNNLTVILNNIIHQIEDVNYVIPHGGLTALHLAVLKDCEESVELLLKRGADPTLINQDGCSPLRLAAEKSRKSQRRCLDLQGRLKHPVLEMLLSAQVKAGITANVSCNDGVSHFHMACMMNHVEAVRFFLDRVDGVSIDQTVNQDSPVLSGYTGMHFAVRYGSFDAACLLLERGADVTLGDTAGMTPLQLLVERNLELADVTNSTKEPNASVEKPFRFLVGTDSLGPEFRGELETGQKILDLLLHKLKCVNNDLGMSELHVACATMNMEMIERLLEQGADVFDVIDSRAPVRPGYTALHIAAHFNVQTVMLLVRFGADMTAKDARGVTPLDICLGRYKVKDVCCIMQSVEKWKGILLSDGTRLLDVVQMLGDPSLVEEKYSRQQVTSDSPLWAGYTMLHLAVKFAPSRIKTADDILKDFDHHDVSRFTLKLNIDELSERVVRACLMFIDVSTQNASGMTALHLAFRQQKRDLVNLLLDKIHEKGMRSNPLDFGNLSHLHIMCVEGRTDIIEAFFNSCNGKINLNDAVQTGFQWYKSCYLGLTYARTCVKPGSTALHLAVIFEKADVTKLLLQHGADPLVMDEDGLTPYMLAFLNNYTSLSSMHDFPLSGLSPRNINPVSSEGLNHFHVACYTNDLPLAKELLRNGLVDLEASINCGLNDTYKGRAKAIKSSKYETGEYDCSDKSLPLARFSGYQALHMAVEGKALEIVVLLLDYSADPRVRNTAGLRPLQLALRNLRFRNQCSKDIVIHLTKNVVIECDGLTTLHVACLLRDGVAIEKAIETGIDIDAQLALESPIWPGSTALHLLLGTYANRYRNVVTKCQWKGLACVDEILIEKLLNYGANVNQPNAEKSTSIHLAYTEEGSVVSGAYTKQNHTLSKNHHPALKLMLKSPRILEANPVNKFGISHFHVACAVADGCLVESYLDAGLADVNQPTHYFLSKLGGTPLHYAMAHGNYEAVEVLLRRGANILAEDRRRNTPLHRAVQNEEMLSRQDYFQRCMEAVIKANTNVLHATNIYGETPLQSCLEHKQPPSIIEFLVKHGACANAINPISRQGFLSHAIRIALEQVMDNAKDLADVDPDTGFNAIHNVVSGDCMGPNFSKLKNVIERLMKKGCDIDHQNAEGKTPLHVALICASKNGGTNLSTNSIEALLQLGADINIVGNIGKLLDKVLQSSGSSYNIMLQYLSKLVLLNFPMSASNKSYCKRIVFQALHYREGYPEELESMHQVQLCEGFSLCDLLSEVAVAKFHSLAHRKQEAIVQFLDSIDLDARFPHFAGLLRLQCRKCLMEPKLCKYALDILARCSLPDCQVPAGYQVLPDLCSENIIRFLDNERMYHLSNLAREEIKRANEAQTDKN